MSRCVGDAVGDDDGDGAWAAASGAVVLSFTTAVQNGDELGRSWETAQRKRQHSELRSYCFVVRLIQGLSAWVSWPTPCKPCRSK